MRERARGCPARGILGAVVPVLGILLAGCATPEGGSSLRGQSGPLEWEVLDIRQTAEERGLLLTWEYTLVLRNTGTSGVDLFQVTTGLLMPGESWGGQGEQPFVRHLAPGGELRVADQQSYLCRDCNPGYAETLFRRGVTRVLVYEGADDQGRSVRATIRIPLDPSVGKGGSDRLSSSGVVGRYHGMLYYYRATSPGRAYPSEEIRATLERAEARVSGEIQTRQRRGTIRAILAGEALSGEFRLDEVTCTFSGTASADGGTLTGTFECPTGENGSLVLNRL